MSIVTIYVGNLSFHASDEDVRKVFDEYGDIQRISLPVDRETGRMRGFAFVELADEASEDKAIGELDGAEWLGRQLRLSKARPREAARTTAGVGRSFAAGDSFSRAGY